MEREQTFSYPEETPTSAPGPQDTVVAILEPLYLMAMLGHRIGVAI